MWSTQVNINLILENQEKGNTVTWFYINNTEKKHLLLREIFNSKERNYYKPT